MTSHAASRDSAHATRYLDDPRWTAIIRGLDQLRGYQLLRLLKHVHAGGGMVCDAYNFDEEKQLWCPLAIGLGVPAIADQLRRPLSINDEYAKTLILQVGRRQDRQFSLNPVSGTRGHFFRDSRVDDIITACRFLLARRTPETGVSWRFGA